MVHRSSILPLLVGLLVAVVVHLGGAWAFAHYQQQLDKPKVEEKPKPEPAKPKADPKPPEPPKPIEKKPSAPSPSLPSRPGEPLDPDAGVTGLAVPDPRVAGKPATVNGRITLFSGTIADGLDVAIVIDGQRIATGHIPGPLTAGQSVQFTQKVTLDKPGEHQVALVVDPDDLLSESDKTNNRRTGQFVWVSPDKEIEVGQTDISPVAINWISYDDFRKLQGQREKFDQPAVQSAVTPDPKIEQAPLDPTPPMPKPAPKQPQTVAAAPPSPQQVAAPQQPKSTPAPDAAAPLSGSREAAQTPDTPARPIKPLQVAENPAAPPRGLPDAKPVAKPEPTSKMTQPSPPSAIAAAGDKPDMHHPITDASPADKSVDAPPIAGEPARQVALLTPAIKPPTGVNPVLPTPIDAPISDIAQRKTPPIAPDVKSDPTDRSMKLDGPGLPRPAPPAPRGVPDAPDEKPQPDKPVDTVAKTADAAPQSDPKPMLDPLSGSREAAPSPAPTLTPTPPAPQPSDEPKPTNAPKDEREAPPVSRIENLVVRPGAVIARHGIQINTVAPRFSPVALHSSIPANPDLVLTFDKAGKVIHVRFAKATGYDNIDGPLLTATYKWTAKGPELDKVPQNLIVTVHILLTPE